MSACSMKAPQYISDGTYVLGKDSAGNDTVEDYAARWSYGYLVGHKEALPKSTSLPTVAQIVEALKVHRKVGVWTDPNTGTVYVDAVDHIPALSDALRIAKVRGELAIYSLMESKEIWVGA